MTGREEQKAKIEKRIDDMVNGRSQLLSDYAMHCLGSGQQPTTVKLYLSYMVERYIKYERYKHAN